MVHTGDLASSTPQRGPPAAQSMCGSAPTYTADEAINICGFGRFQWFMLVYAGMAWMADAMEIMVLSFLGAAARCQWGLGPNQEALLTSLVFAGMALGTVAWGHLADTRGRRTAFVASVLVTAAAGLASAAAPTYMVLLLCRLVVGGGLSGATVAHSLLMELLPAVGRGTFMVAVEPFWTVGTLVEALLAWRLLGGAGWRVLLLVSTAPLGVLLVMSFWMVESPRYLLTHGRVAEAQAVLEHVARVNRVKLPPGQLAPVLRGASQDAETGGQEAAPLLAAAAPLTLSAGSGNHRRPPPAPETAAGQGCEGSGTAQLTGEHPAGHQISIGLQQQQKQHEHNHHHKGVGVDGVVVASGDALHHVAPLVHRRHSLTVLANSCAPHEAQQHAAASRSGNSTPKGGTAAAAAAGWGQAEVAAEPAGEQEHLLPGSMRSDWAPSHSAHGANGSSSSSSTGNAHKSAAGVPMWRHPVHTNIGQQQHHGSSPRATTSSHSSSSSSNRWSKLQEATKGVQSSLGQLFGPQLRATTLQMTSAWLAAAFAYYGLVQLVTQLHMGQGSSGAGCSQGRVQVDQEEFRAVVITAAAELPAVAWAAFTTAVWGRRLAVSSSLAGTALFLLPLLVLLPSNAGQLQGLGGPAFTAAHDPSSAGSSSSSRNLLTGLHLGGIGGGVGSAFLTPASARLAPGSSYSLKAGVASVFGATTMSRSMNLVFPVDQGRMPSVPTAPTAAAGMPLPRSQPAANSRALQAVGTSPGPETGSETGSVASAASGARIDAGFAQPAHAGVVAGAINALKAAVLQQAGSSRWHAGVAAHVDTSSPYLSPVPGVPLLLPSSRPLPPLAAAGGAPATDVQQQEQQQQQQQEHEGRVSGRSDPRVVACFFMARLFVMSALTLLWVFTPELYPTSIRTLGLGVCNAAARVGGLLCPFAAVTLVQHGHLALATSLFAGVAAVAAAAVALVDKDTAAQPLEDVLSA